MRVLVLDDSKVMLRILKNVLVKVGITNIITATNGSEGLDEFNKCNFDLILTDWNMPVMNGLEFVKEVRKKDKDIQIVMITTEGSKKDVITAIKAGVNNYIVKPFTPDTFKYKLLNIMDTVGLNIIHL